MLMYHDFYELQENPFNVTADPDFFFSSRYHCEAISHLIYGIKQRMGILVITGEIGTGKTTLCRTLLKQADDSIKFAFILNPKFSDLQLLQVIVHDLGIKTHHNSKLGLIHTLNEFLLSESNKNNNVVIVIDEAQNLSIRQLEQIRLLSNLETEKEKLLQIILVGQPELSDKLELHALRQLRQRVAVYYKLQALEHQDIKKYIEHRIVKSINSKARHRVTFTDEAIAKIYDYTRGTPRTINILCDRALLAGFVSETFSIDDTIIETCAKEVLNW